MKQKRAFTLIIVGATLVCLGFTMTAAQAQTADWAKGCWERTFGDGSAHASDIQTTSDGGYIVAGVSNSDGWVIKLDAQGERVWDHYLGYGSGTVVEATTDDGYIVATGFWESRLFKLDTQGNEVWNRSLNGGINDIQATSTGGYILVGYIKDKYSEGDGWVIQLDAEGNIEKEMTFGDVGEGGRKDFLEAIHITRDGGYIVVGRTSPLLPTNFDAWVIKLDAQGHTEWDRTFDASDLDGAYDIQTTSDGGYIITGNKGNKNAWVIKLDAQGHTEWECTLGRGNGKTIRTTSDGGYIVAVEDSDVLIIKLDSYGEEMWNRSFGSGVTKNIETAQDGGYIVAATDQQPNIVFNIRVIKLNSEGLLYEE